ncbi:MAG: SagB/ThcOx family dehydrogenase [Prevotella sp.]|nr:SagB/ThcOx family dehydrogenase [Prevotella sp.]
MKFYLTILLFMTTMISNAQDITLPAPDLTQTSLPTIEALATRHSVREYGEGELTLQDISNLCWAACGQTRDEEHITAPSAMNRQEIRLFLFCKDGVYEYLAKENVLRKAAEGDNRNLIAGPQDFVLNAALALVMVVDFDKFGIDDDRALMMGCVDAGNISENINLYCQSTGLATVPRATMDTAAIKQLLGFGDRQIPVMNNPVGFPKE